MATPEYHDQLRNAALNAIACGWPVFLTHGIRDGVCTCGKADCRNAGKHPHGDLTPNGLHNATTDPDTMRAWLERLPDGNLAMATGPCAGVWVLDIDLPDGLETIDRLEAEHGMLPGTLVAWTGSGGLHVYFAYPRRAEVKTGTKVLGPGVDIRGRGGYVILPPSRHISGGTYRWARTDDTPPDSPDFWRAAPAPAWLTAMVMAAPERPIRASFPASGAADDGGAISEGGRNQTLTSKGGAMRRAGFSESEILAALLRMNADRCRPPLADAEVSKIAHSVARYQPAAPQPMLRASNWKPYRIIGGKVSA